MTKKIVQTDRGLLTFYSAIQLDAPTHRLLITERHTLAAFSGEQAEEGQCVMRCWTEDKVRQRLDLAGFIPLGVQSDYDEGSPLGLTVALCALPAAPPPLRGRIRTDEGKPSNYAWRPLGRSEQDVFALTDRLLPLETGRT